MQIGFQILTAFYFFIEGPWDPLLLTLTSIVLTLFGAAAHRNIYREVKDEANESQSETLKRKLRWLNFTAFFLVSAFPTLAIKVLGYYYSDRMSVTGNMWFGILLMDLPGILYFFQAILAGRASGNQWKWPRYL